MTPTLVAHEPKGPKGAPGLHLECYISDEDRYHPAIPLGASEEAAKTQAGEEAQDVCMLACPCAGAVQPTLAPLPVQPTLPPVSSTLAPYPAKVAGCKGISSVDRCWFLSEKGESCDSACASHGSGCKYSWAAPPQEDITPWLVQHVPAKKQEPWIALECYVPEEDRYHQANANAVKHDDEEGGDVTHSECSLACPCTGTCDGYFHPTSTPAPPPSSTPAPPPEEPEETCTWTAPAECQRTFMYQDKKYTGCAMWVDHPTPWCSHDKIHAGHWSKCKRNCN